MKLLVYIIFILKISSYVQPYKILVFYPFPIRSLNLLGEGVVRHLLDSGHEVTYATVYPIKEDTGAKLRQIDLSSNKKMLSGEAILNIENVIKKVEPGDDIWYHQEFGRILANITFDNKILLEFLRNENERFDVVIADYYETEVFAGISALYSCPMIWMWSMGVDWIALRLVDEPSNPAYTVDYSSSNVIPLNFIQRTQELWTQIHWYILKRYITMPQEENIYETVLRPLIEKRRQVAPKYQDLIYNVSLIFGNDYNIEGTLPRLPQNYKLISGQHIRMPVDPLPKNIEKLMNDSTHGVIYFSMGSTWQSKDIPKSLTQELLKVFGEFKQTVIWKYEEDLPNLPQNVHIIKWAPQHSILAHSKCLVFITHGGQLSSTESMHFGIPVIGIPISFDQYRNVNKAVLRGYAIKVDLNFDLPIFLRNALKTMLSDKRYFMKAKEISKIYHDRPIPAGKELVYWVEHVIRTRGAFHLRSPALLVTWYQKLYLDLIIIVLLILFVILKGLKSLIGIFSNKNIRRRKQE